SNASLTSYSRREQQIVSEQDLPVEPCGHYTEPPIRWPATNAQRMKGLLLKDTVAPLCSAQLPVND
ncbi:hypothetical protein KUCAC02_016010, partial [Chaenocephalus aceratus]